MPCKFYYQGVQQMLFDEGIEMRGFIFSSNVNFILKEWEAFPFDVFSQ